MMRYANPCLLYLLTLQCIRLHSCTFATVWHRTSVTTVPIVIRLNALIESGLVFHGNQLGITEHS